MGSRRKRRILALCTPELLGWIMVIIQNWSSHQIISDENSESDLGMMLV